MIKTHNRDRPWVDFYITVMCGPFAMPSVSDLRTAVGKLADRYPDSRLRWRLSESSTHWMNDRPLESIVVERGWNDEGTPADNLGALYRDEALDPPLTLVRYPNYLGLKMSHALGDGRLSLTIISAVIRTALSGETSQWPIEAGGRRPLLKASLNTFGRRPFLIRLAMKDRIPAAIEECTSGEEMVPWMPSRHTVHASISRARVDEFFSRGAELAPLSSKFGLQIALVLNAFERAGIAVSDDVRVIVDLRRYLGWRYIDGNFIAGVPMKLAGFGPEQLTANIRKTMASGRPLANQLLASTKRRDSHTDEVTSAPSKGRPRLTFSNLSRSPEIEVLPFRSDMPAGYVGSVTPDGPWGMTFLLGENPQILSINATFHDNVIDSTLVTDALERAVSDPIAALFGERGST